MSAWRLVVRELYERGPLASRQFVGVPDAHSALRRARQLGLVESPGRGGARGYKPWAITELGRAYCEGRAVLETLFVPHPGTRARAKGSVCVINVPRLADQSVGCGVGA